MRTTEDERARYEERQRKAQEQREREFAAKLAKLVRIGDLIKPLVLVMPQPDRLSGTIRTEAGEELGTLRYQQQYTWKEGRIRLLSPRIPSRGRYNTRGGGHRDYKNIDSAVAAIEKFCIPVSDDERRANVLRKELQRYRTQLLSED